MGTGVWAATAGAMGTGASEPLAWGAWASFWRLAFGVLPLAAGGDGAFAIGAGIGATPLSSESEETSESRAPASASSEPSSSWRSTSAGGRTPMLAAYISYSFFHCSLESR